MPLDRAVSKQKPNAETIAALLEATKTVKDWLVTHPDSAVSTTESTSLRRLCESPRSISGTGSRVPSFFKKYHYENQFSST